MSDKEEGNFSHSMTDLMTSLAIVFLILAVAMIVQFKINEHKSAKKYNQIVEKYREIKKTKTELLNELIKILDLKKKGESFSTSDNCLFINGDQPYTIKISLSGLDKCKKRGFFFEIDKPSLIVTSDVQDTITSISNVYESICKMNIIKNIEKVQILGHTDEDSSRRNEENCKNILEEKNIKKLQCGNINLSSSRAENVFLLIGKSIANKDENSRENSNDSLLKCFTDKTEISGRGPFDPETLKLVKNEKRRVEIVINLLQPKLTDE